MTFDEFIKKHEGEFLEVAGSANAKNQCVDLANGYIRDVLNLPIIEWTNAKDFPERAGDSYEFIKNTPEFIPERGDIVVWNGRVGGGAGHIAVIIEADINKFKSFDQNWPTGTPCHVQEHSYSNVKGFLRARNVSTDPDTIEVGLEDWERIRQESENYNKTRDYLEIPSDYPKVTTFERVRDAIAGIKSRVTDLTNRVATAEAEVKNREEQVSRLKVQLSDEQKLRKDLLINLSNVEKLTKTYEGRIGVLQEQVNQFGKEKGKLALDLAECQANSKEIKENLIKQIVEWFINLITKKE